MAALPGYRLIIREIKPTRQAYLVPVNVLRFDCPLVDQQNLNLDFQLLFTNPHTSGFVPILYKIPLPPFISSGKVPFAATNCSGLRAPPAL